ncbi:uncharacterized protein LOC126083240 isoform X2 [Elephas maximus indicus]|uniref:uncharacterized protein LOC126083240 isoform X2 n=1 Tax=Elephas maximus indicus TaxID=99487 RepID=UPI00211686E6|nr:uncharacterized protein LOC126083240 isoform X2 [Elephas maximus indicus]
MGKVSLSHQKREEREAERPTPAPAGPDTHRAWQRLLVPKATSGSPCRAADHSSRARCVCSRGGLTEARLATEPETGAEYGPRTVPRIMFPGPTGGQVSGQEDAPSAPAGLPSRPAPRGRTSGSEPPATAEVPEHKQSSRIPEFFAFWSSEGWTEEQGPRSGAGSACRRRVTPCLAGSQLGTIGLTRWFGTARVEARREKEAPGQGSLFLQSRSYAPSSTEPCFSLPFLLRLGLAPQPPSPRAVHPPRSQPYELPSPNPVRPTPGRSGPFCASDQSRYTGAPSLAPNPSRRRGSGAGVEHRALPCSVQWSQRSLTNCCVDRLCPGAETARALSPASASTSRWGLWP